ncbi:MAG TPA: glycosyltransferase [Bacteroidales bacterium]|nr:glycosyltransferase [Bacteroidales bacterium]
MSERYVEKSKNILICPLNWGLGHACRIIPIIEYCIETDKTIIIASNGSSFKLLKQRFPSLIQEYIPSPILNYAKKQSIGFRFYCSFLLLFLNIYRERKYVKNIIKKYAIDTIISDNRPGIFSRKVKSIYITHQVNVFNSAKKGYLSGILTKLHLRIIKKYTYCFVPDYPDNSIAGRLSENTTGLELVYLGPLSRFSKMENNIPDEITHYNIVCIVSGPEPQRTVFEELLITKFKNTKHNVLILRGLPDNENFKTQIGSIDLLNHCNDSTLFSYLKLSEFIICRSGYSSIMDLITIGKNAILVPTPGQPEQEYLGQYLQKYGFKYLEQKDILDFDFNSINLPTLKAFAQNSMHLKKILDLYL